MDRPERSSREEQEEEEQRRTRGGGGRKSRNGGKARTESGARGERGDMGVREPKWRGQTVEKSASQVWKAHDNHALCGLFTKQWQHGD